MPAPQPDPNTHASLRRYVENCGGVASFAARHGLAHRTAERIYSGTRPCPNRLRDEIRANHPGESR